MFEKRMPMFPRLHKCHYCKARLDKSMPIICKYNWWAYIDSYNLYWYCCKDCAKAEVAVEKAKKYYNDKLDREIRGEDEE